MCAYNIVHVYKIIDCYISYTVGIYCFEIDYYICFPDGSTIKNLPANAGDTGLIPGMGRLPGKGNGNPLQYSCLGNPMDRGAWQATDHGVTKSQT